MNCLQFTLPLSTPTGPRIPKKNTFRGLCHKKGSAHTDQSLEITAMAQGTRPLISLVRIFVYPAPAKNVR